MYTVHSTQTCLFEWWLQIFEKYFGDGHHVDVLTTKIGQNQVNRRIQYTEHKNQGHQTASFHNSYCESEWI